MQVQPYLSFDGCCEQALEFYTKALGAKVEHLMRAKEAPPMPADGAEGCGPGEGTQPAFMQDPEKIMHSAFRVGDTLVMAADGCAPGQRNFQGISLALTVKGADEARRKFAALTQGGRVQMPLGETFFSPAFGVVGDKFGVSWMVVAE